LAKIKKIIVGTVIILGVLAITFALHAGDVLKNQNSGLSNLLYKERETSEIVVIAIDDATIAPTQNGGLDSMANWSRNYYAKVLNQIEKGNPNSVFFDIFFSSARDSGDAVFANELNKYDNDYLIKMPAGEKYLENDAFIYESEYTPLKIFSEATTLGFYNEVSNLEESTNLRTIYALPAYVGVENGQIEEHIDLKIAREKLATTEPFDIPLENGQMLINYAKEAYNWPTYSFVDVYNGEIDSSVFENKIVLIGATATILQDWYYTPIDTNARTPGLEIHANAIQTILDGKFLEYQSAVGFLVTTGIMLLVAVLAFLYLPIIAGAIVLIIEIALFPFYAQFSFNRGIIPDLLWPVFAVFIAYLTVMAYRNFTEFSEKRKIKNAFAHYVSPELVEQITLDPGVVALGGDKRNISVLFLDIENFTGISENLKPQEVVTLINFYFDALSKLIMAHGGTVDKFEGDAIMAIFGAPVPSVDHAQKICETALSIREKMAELNQKSGYNLNLRIGLATGDAVVGNMGSTDRFDYTAMGDTVNTASRLEGANKFYDTKILVTEGTKLGANAKFFFRKVDTVCLKGKGNAMAIHELMGLNENASPDGKALVTDFETALTSYQKGDFTGAEAHLNGILSRLPQDGPSKTLLARIANFKTTPPKDWDGVWRFSEK